MELRSQLITNWKPLPHIGFRFVHKSMDDLDMSKPYTVASNQKQFAGRNVRLLVVLSTYLFFHVCMGRAYNLDHNVANSLKFRGNILYCVYTLATTPFPIFHKKFSEKPRNVPYVFAIFQLTLCDNECQQSQKYVRGRVYHQII